MDDETQASIAPSVRRLKQRAIGDRLRESLLFLPAVLLVAGVVVEAGAHELDRHWRPGWLGLFAMSPDAAVTLLSTIAGATITTAGVVFSLLVVSLQAGQAPPLTMTLAIGSAPASVLAIVVFLNRITRQQYVGRIMERIQGEAGEIWPRPDAATGRRVARLVGEAVIIGTARTMQQDIDFALRQLNDIGLRALSPAVNDPTTAIESILRVSSVMRPLLQADLPAQAHRDEHDRTLLTPWDLDHAEYVRHAYGQIRLYAGSHPQVALTLIRVLRMLRDALSERAGRTAALDEIDRQLAAVIADARRAGLPDAELTPIRDAARQRQE